MSRANYLRIQNILMLMEYIIVSTVSTFGVGGKVKIFGAKICLVSNIIKTLTVLEDSI